jgi:hypothetical protein
MDGNATRTPAPALPGDGEGAEGCVDVDAVNELVDGDNIE